MSLNDILLRLGLAVLLGAGIGFERQWRNHYAGLRTNTLVTIGSAGLMIFAQMLPGADVTGVGRIASQIISGVGFLCAGVIMHEGINVKGLNTSASLWCSTCVGMFVGAGMFIPGGILAVFVVLTNLVLRPLVYYINSRTPMSDELEAHYTLSVACSDADVNRLRTAVLKHVGARAANVKTLGTKQVSAGVSQICVDFIFPMRVDGFMEKTLQQISQEPGITAIEWRLK